MSTQNMHFHGEIRIYQLFLVEKRASSGAMDIFLNFPNTNNLRCKLSTFCGK